MRCYKLMDINNMLDVMMCSLVEVHLHMFSFQNMVCFACTWCA
jgi:hypothetical protein